MLPKTDSHGLLIIILTIVRIYFQLSHSLIADGQADRQENFS